MPCPSCRRATCLLEEHKDALVAELGTLDDSLDNSKKRNHLYRSIITSEYGVLGARRRVQIPDCIISFICTLCPSPDGNYMGFREAGHVGLVPQQNINDGVSIANGARNNNNMNNVTMDETLVDNDLDMNASFADVEEETYTGESINFSVGEKACLQMHFNYPQYSMEHDRLFVMTSPVTNGWDIQCHSNFNTATFVCDNKTDFKQLFPFCFINTDGCTKFTLTRI
eukprot:scaffold11429_cov48-Cyclotella_meneghiniana.AAC.5